MRERASTPGAAQIQGFLRTAPKRSIDQLKDSIINMFQCHTYNISYIRKQSANFLKAPYKSNRQYEPSEQNAHVYG